jgi:hypothetical protein
MSTLFDMSLPRWPKPNTSAIFSDESSLGEQFAVFGGLYFWWPSDDYKNQIATFERELAEIKTKYGITTVKWQDVPTPSVKLNGYKALVEYLASQTKNHLRFKCMVVDTHKYPLKKKSVGATDKLVGYLKYYTVHLADGIMATQKGYFYDITIDDYEWRPDTGHDSKALGRAVEGRYLNLFQPADVTIDKYKWQHSELNTADDEDSNLIQMADLLAGAVAFCRNGGLERTSTVSTGRIELIAVIRKCYGGVRLDKYQQARGPFHIWNFTDPDGGPSPSLTAPGNVPNFP